MTEEIEATPEKSFFIRMLTRDIALDDCVLDLLDNCLDGAKRVLEREERAGEKQYGGFEVNIECSQDEFRIADNCGGIRLEDARSYAFHFGRDVDDVREPTESIGIYGIGMKRAMFKIGSQISVRSSTRDNAFEVEIDVDEWERDSDEWKFELDLKEVWEEPGTKIIITDLNSTVGDRFTDTAFLAELRRTIARDYAEFLQRGLLVRVNGVAVTPWNLSLREGGDFKPARVHYEDDGVMVEIIAGMAAPPPEDSSPEVDMPNRDRYGWFVLCNDRVVLAGDKSARTIWGRNGFPSWHNQYNGFLGIVSFTSAKPGELPWTTTKRDVDETAGVYRRALKKMRELTRPFIEYTNERKENRDRAEELESDTESKPIDEIEERDEIGLPDISGEPKRRRTVSIQFRKPVDEVQNAAEALGNRNMPAKRVAIKAFDYFYDREVGG